MRILAYLGKTINVWFFIIVLFLFFLLRLPSLFEPYWYGDEGIYQVVGNAINNGRLLYRDILDNKPPLLYVLYAFLNSEQFTVRLASLFVGLISVIIFFFLAKKLFAKPKIYSFTTIIFALLFGLPIIEGNIANAENFMILPILIAALLVLYLFDERKHKTSPHQKYLSPYLILNAYYLIPFFAGLLLAIAFLIKIVALFDFTAFFVFLIITRWKSLQRDIRSEVKKMFYFLMGFVSPIIITALFFFLNDAFKDFWQATFMQNIGYVNYGNRLNMPINLLFIKLIALGLFTIFLFSKRQHLKPATLFILLWFAFSLFNAFFSDRPYTHYLLVLLPSFSLLLGLLFLDQKNQKIIAILLLFSLILVFKNFVLYTKIFAYYQNFILFLTNKKTVYSYQRFFDKKTPIDYEIALFIKNKLKNNDSVFIWGNNAQVYKMLEVLPPGKYTVAYHITNYSDGVTNTRNALKSAKPKFVIIMPDQTPIPFSLSNYNLKINIDNVLIYERIF